MSILNNNKSVKKPFCKICFDSGKSENEYTSHFVKSEPGPKGKVVCPTLQNLECSYCHSKGHTKSHCVVLKKNIKQDDRNRSRYAYNEKKEKKEKYGKRKNVFECLDECSSDEDEVEEVEEEFPVLVAVSDSVKVMICEEEVKVTSYASMAAKEVKVVKEVKVDVRSDAKVESEARVKAATRCWADWSDSDSDEDDGKSESSWDAKMYPEDRKEYYEVKEEVGVGYLGYVEETDW